MPNKTMALMVNGSAKAKIKGPVGLGIAVVELQKLKRKYQEMEQNRKVFRAAFAKQAPGTYKGYKVVPVREVEVKAHSRKAHNRLLIQP